MAQEAGVAIGTASRVLNEQPNVNEEARRKVKDAAKRLKYVSLRKRKASRRKTRNYTGNNGQGGSLGVLIFGMDQSFIQLPITAEALQGIERQASTMNWNMLLANNPNLEGTPAFLTEPTVEGLILRCPPAGRLPDWSTNEFLRTISGFPSVWLFNRPEGMSGDLCSYDTAKAVSQVIDHFLEMGHERIGFLHPRPGNLLLEQHKKHFFFTAEKAGLKPTLLEKKGAELSHRLPLPAIQDVHYVKPLLEKWKKMPANSRPTALFVGADSAAVQTYIALEDMGVEVGKDVSIISCNNEKSLNNVLTPALTTVEIFSEVVGQRAVDQLIWRLRNPDMEQGMRILIEPKLIRRKSVADLKKR